MTRTTYPPYDSKVPPPYRFDRLPASVAHAPERPLYPLERTPCKLTGPVFSDNDVAEGENDMTRARAEPPIGQVIIVRGQVTDEEARPVPNALVEIWQANAAGRYDHAADQSGRTIDPNFHGVGRCLTDQEGRYRFRTIKPAPYPGGGAPEDRRNLPVDPNFRGFGRCLTDTRGAYRFRTIRPGPAPHPGGGWQAPCINVSIFCVGLLRRLLTRIYFAGDPRNDDDPILLSIADTGHRNTLLAREVAAHPVASYRFDIVMQGEGETAYFID